MGSTPPATPAPRRRAQGRDARRHPGHSHRPTEPRIILTWDGYAWQPERIADDYAAAQRILHRIEGDGVISMTPMPPRKTRIGKHRKP